MITWFMIAGGVALMSALVLMIFWHRRTKWWEFLALLPLPIASCWIAGCVAEKGLTQDYEDLGGCITQARYYEDWNELEQRSRQVSDGNGNTRTEYYYVNVHHSAYWEAHGSILGKVWSISKNEYQRFVSKWNTPVFTNLRRSHNGNDGDLWTTHWPGDDETLEPCCAQRSYENRTLAAPSVFKFTMPEGDWPVYSHQQRYGYDHLTALGPTITPEEQRALALTNSKLSMIRIWVLVYTSQPRNVVAAQEAHWHGGARNDAVLCVGVDDERKVKWAEVFGWTDSEAFKVDLRNQAIDQETLDIIPIADWALVNAPVGFVPKDFSEFEYLEIETPLWMLLVGALIAGVLNTGLSVWVVRNEFDDDHARQKPWRARFRRPFFRSRR